MGFFFFFFFFSYLVIACAWGCTLVGMGLAAFRRGVHSMSGRS